MPEWFASFVNILVQEWLQFAYFPAVYYKQR
jgi:hypothetical protein